MTNKKKLKDPHIAREKAKYGNPIASREFILSIIKDEGKPVSQRQLAIKLNLSTGDSKLALKRRLKAMVRDNQLERVHKKSYFLTRERELISGVLSFDSKKCLWCIPNQGGSKILIPSYKRDFIAPGAKAVVSVPTETLGNVREGRIVEVSLDIKTEVMGRFIVEHGKNYVVPHSKEILQDILIPEKHTKGANEDDIVLVTLTPQYSSDSQPVGKILKIMGASGDKNIEIASVIKSYALPNSWSKEIKDEVTKMPDPATKKFRNRIDLQDLPFVTIDGEDARDFDDAIYCEARTKGSYKLYVAIADVSHYVKASTVLDKEAKLRGNSVYFPNKVVPMLPEKLSNNLCSLKPNVPRLSLVCEMSISAAGKLTRYKFFEAIICSKARLTYNKVAAMLAGDAALCKRYSDIMPHIEQANNLYQILLQQRKQRGALDFDTVETRMLFNKQGKISKIEPVQRNVAHKIIEEFMLCANVATARFLAKNKIPSIYRIHESPLPDKLTELNNFLMELGLGLAKNKKKQITPIAYSDLLRSIAKRPDYAVIQTMLLRSLSQAVYSSDNIGHFGLAYTEYTHFTSPIRRYPDLVVHRLIKQILSGRWQLPDTDAQKAKVNKQRKKLSDLAAHCSMTERRADDATREVERWLKCQYIAKHIGETFTGVISGVNKFGFFVQLNNIFIDGLVHVNTLSQDYFIFDPIKHRLVGETTGIQYSLGMAVNIIIASVLVDSRRIDFNLVKTKTKTKSKAKSRSKANMKTRKKIKRKNKIKN